MNDITFFMIVTPRDAVIADYAVKSYRKLRNLDYALVVYSNYLLPEQKRFYFPRWERNPRVRIVRNEHHDLDIEAIKSRIDSEDLEGPFEYCDPIWDRELPKIQTAYVAQVDADFEILNPRFVYYMIDALGHDPQLIGYSTDYSPPAVTFEPYKGHYIILNERNHTWFCIYRREAFALSQVSHAYYREELTASSIRVSGWDSSAWFQKSLRDQGWRFDYLHGRFRRDFIHYGAFSKNTLVTRDTVATFRRVALVENWLPWRLSHRLRNVRRKVLPRLENNRYQWVRREPIAW
jgi:hypothetical protein